MNSVLTADVAVARAAAVVATAALARRASSRVGTCSPLVPTSLLALAL